MPNWTFEPGHSAAEFRARHMMVSWVRGHIKNVRGRLRFDRDRPADAWVEAEMDASALWTGVKERDEHLRSADFLDVAHHPTITFRSQRVECVGADTLSVRGDLAIRGVTRPVVLDVRYLAQWSTPWWEDGVDKGPKLRAGFVATTRIRRTDFGVNWNGALEKGGVVVGEDIDVTIDIEAIRDDSAL